MCSRPARARTGLGVVTAVLVLTSVGTASGTRRQGGTLPPNGGFDTRQCVGRAADPPTNGRLIVRKRRGSALYSVREDETGLKRLTHPRAGFTDYAPAVSADGRHMSFVRGLA